ncbi:MAG: MarC family transcriptional regulator [Hyphomicrobiales bacterium]|nr:MAG: MarC family transcriptional regulator [Hyphomicrobiales bacterium]
MDWAALLTIVLPTFVTFFVVIDPIGLVPFYMTLTEGQSKKAKAKIARRSVVIATVILTIFALVGKNFLELLGISLSAFRIAGGMLLFLIAVEMLFEKRTERREKNVASETDDDDEATEDEEEDESRDVAVFPLAVPFLAGPGSMATIILLMSKYEGQWETQLAIYGVMLTCLLTCFIMFKLSGKLDKIITPKVTKVATRLLGVLLAALSIEFILSGLRQSVLFT